MYYINYIFFEHYYITTSIPGLFAAYINFNYARSRSINPDPIFAPYVSNVV